MYAKSILGAALLLSLLSGCGQLPGSTRLATVQAGTVTAKDDPSWGTGGRHLLVPDNVMADLGNQEKALAQQFKGDYGSNPDMHVGYQVSLVASQDGFRTSLRAHMPETPVTSPYAQDVDLGDAPSGTYTYYLVVSARADEYDAAGTFVQTWKTYGPLYVSDYGRNFTAIAR